MAGLWGACTPAGSTGLTLQASPSWGEWFSASAWQSSVRSRRLKSPVRLPVATLPGNCRCHLSPKIGRWARIIHVRNLPSSFSLCSLESRKPFGAFASKSPSSSSRMLQVTRQRAATHCRGQCELTQRSRVCRRQLGPQCPPGRTPADRVKPGDTVHCPAPGWSRQRGPEALSP